VSVLKVRKAVLVAVGTLALVVGMTATAPSAHAQEMVGGRKVKSKGAPIYPELARKMNIAGTVKVEIVIAPNGSVKSAKAIGGHPLLIDAALDAAKKYKFEPGGEETTTQIAFDFKPTQ
jgi:TonB family protein